MVDHGRGLEGIEILLFRRRRGPHPVKRGAMRAGVRVVGIISRGLGPERCGSCV